MLKIHTVYSDVLYLLHYIHFYFSSEIDNFYSKIPIYRLYIKNLR